MITMYEPDGEPAGTGGGGGAAAGEGRGTGGAGGVPDDSAPSLGTAVALHDVELVPGTSRAEFVGTMLDRVPAQARFVEADGDVDVTLRWRTDEPSALDLLITSEGVAWRAWRDAERRARDFARLHRRAADVARTAHSSWYRAASDLVEQHPAFGNPDAASDAAAARRGLGGANADAETGQERARHAAPGDPPTRRLPSRTELAAQAMIGRLDLGDQAPESADTPTDAVTDAVMTDAVVTDAAVTDAVTEAATDAASEDATEPGTDAPTEAASGATAEAPPPRRRVGHDPDVYAGPDDSDRERFEAALAAWHAAADRDGIDVPLRADDDVVEVTEHDEGRDGR